MATESALIVRVLRGDPITNRGKHVLPGFEVLFTVRHGARALYPPHSVTKTFEDFQLLHDALYSIDIGKKGCKYVIEAPFPPETTDKDVLKDPTLMKPADLQLRLDQLSTWIHAMLELVGKLDAPINNRMLAQIAKFMEISAPVAPKDSTFAAQEDPPANIAMRECLLNGYHNAIQGPRNKVYKRKTKKVKGLVRFLEERIEIDTFEQRFDQTTGSYYLYNPYTGELITDTATLDRYASTWVLPDPHVEVRELPGGTNAFRQVIYPQLYSSTYKKKKFVKGQVDKHKAAVLLTAMARGFVQRRRIRYLHKERYHRCYDSFNECCYFLDLRTNESSWYKPLLAHPFSIQPPPTDVRPDREDMSGGPLNQKSFGTGTTKVPKKPLTDPNKVDAEATAREPEVIDLNLDFLIVSMWIDENVPKLHKMEPIYECYQKNNWPEMFRYLLTYCDDDLVTLFTFHALARMHIPLEPMPDGSAPTKCEQIVRKVMNYLYSIMQAWTHNRKFGCNHLLGVGYALLHIFESHPCRLAFFYGFESRIESVMKLVRSTTSGSISINYDEIGDILSENLDHVLMEDEWNAQDPAYVEFKIESKMQILCNMLKNIPVEITQEQHEKGVHGNITSVARPTQRGAELTLILMKMFGVLAHERESRESVGIKCAHWVIQAIRTCIEDPYVVQYGLRCLYNFMYYCSEGWRWIKTECDIEFFMDEVKKSPVFGDDVVAREYRRVELSLLDDGWRGNVEKIMAQEMEEHNIAVFLQKKNSPEASPIKEESDAIDHNLEDTGDAKRARRKLRAERRMREQAERDAQQDAEEQAEAALLKPAQSKKSALLLVE